MAGNNKYENDDDTPNLALVITSGHDHDAYAVFRPVQSFISIPAAISHLIKTSS